MMRCLFVFLLLSCSPAFAGDTWVTFGFLSLHDEPGYNGANYGLGIEHRVGDRVALVAGAYENSHHERSRYVGANVVAASVRGVHLGLTVGAVDGYRDSYDKPPSLPCNQGVNRSCGDSSEHETGTRPLLSPTAAIHGKRWGANLALVPPVGKDGAAAIALQIKYRIGR